MSLGEDVLGSLRNDNGDAVDNIDLTMNLYFTYESRNTLKSFSLFLTIKSILKMNMERSLKLWIEIEEISRRRSRSSDNTEFGHFMSLLCGECKEIYKDLWRTSVYSHCSAHETFFLVTFLLPLPSWFS